MTSRSKLTPEVSKQFKKDLKRSRKQGRDITSLRTLMEKLTSQENLDSKYRDHALGGNWKGYRDCHVKPDWLLIYCISSLTIRFERLGSHSELFG
ncbi:mRNA interferase YafQ [Chlamydiales bacterium SCGC AG-110-P3]|nr:mRNA interferase YafQ [Chlamydiales bacterium SCGC AG-110-P3]